MRLKKGIVSGPSNIIYSKVIVGAFVANILIILLIFLLRDGLPPSLPLWYGSAAGGRQLADKEALAIPSILSIAVLIISLVIAKLSPDTFLQRVVVGIGVLATILSTIAVIEIVLLVGSVS